jgi:hypothetical protein
VFWLKACPRCHGDLHEIRDIGATYVSCLQCGQILTEQQEKNLPRATLRASLRLVKAGSGNAAA